MELTCWWNQLWIIFMNMKSITAAASNPSTLFISLWEWEMKWSWWNCCFAAQGNSPAHSISFKEIDWLLFLRSLRHLVVWVGCSSRGAGYGRLAANAPQREKTSPTKQTTNKARRQTKVAQLISPTAVNEKLNSWNFEFMRRRRKKSTSGAPSHQQWRGKPFQLSLPLSARPSAVKRKKVAEMEGC